MFLVIEVCSHVDLLKTIYFIKTVLNIIYIIAPVFLIIKLILELFNGLISSENFKWKILLDKIIVIVSLFLIVPVISSVMALIGNTSYSTCLEDANLNNIKLLKQKDEELKKLNELNKNTLSEATNIIDSAIIKNNYQEPSSNEGTGVGRRYNLTDSELTQLARLCKCEQGTAEGAKAEASLIANRFELIPKGYTSIYSYAKNSKWWWCANKMNDSSYDNAAVKEAVRDALVNGNRSLDYWVDEHDCWNCSKDKCENGRKGDICSVTNHNIAITNVADRSSYIKDVSVIVNIHGAKYIFSKFPTNSSDPFGYTQSTKNKYDSLSNR